jgi:hypothetical protein
VESRALVLGLLVAGCGGKVDTSLDAGLDAATDAPMNADVPVMCTSVTFSKPPQNPGGSCDATGSWSCGTTKYSVECTCSLQGADPQCTCTTVNGTVSSVTGGSQASCICYGLTAQSVADVCGFPH